MVLRNFAWKGPIDAGLEPPAQQANITATALCSVRTFCADENMRGRKILRINRSDRSTVRGPDSREKFAFDWETT